MQTSNVAESAEWRRLETLAARRPALDLRRLFADDPRRVERMTGEVGDLVVDWSKHLIDDETLDALLALARARGVSERAAAMAAGEPVNTTENRPALHTALRAPADAVITAGGRNVVPDVHRTLARMGEFCDRLRSGERTGATGKPVSTLVNIGIGGSDLGPAMAYEALAASRHRRLRCEFVANVDGADLASALDGLDPETTLFVVSSKTFSTTETLLNARTARAWLERHLGSAAAARHFAAVTADPAAAQAFGIAAADTFELWDWVGGRYSLGSAIGLSLMAAIGPDAFAELLGGMRAVDEHFLSAAPEANLPLLLGLLAVWYRSFCGLPTRAVLPYAQRLRGLPAYLRQLDMESNGKRVGADGEAVSWDTGPVVWGEPGTKGQHSFHQFLHQGTTVVPADFIVTARPDASAAAALANADEHHVQLVANCLAQSAALAFGSSASAGSGASSEAAATALAAHRELPGNRPSTTIMAPALTPSVLGQLIALYEHQVFVQGAIWGINSFDQWGVEHGKKLASGIAAELADEPGDSDPGDSDPGDGEQAGSAPLGEPAFHDPSTAALIARCRAMRQAPPEQ